MDKEEYIYDKNKLYLNVKRSARYQKKGYLFLELTSDDPDDTSLDEELAIVAYDIISNFSKNHIVLYSASYKKIKYESKKWFGIGWKPAKI